MELEQWMIRNTFPFYFVNYLANMARANPSNELHTFHLNFSAVSISTFAVKVVVNRCRNASFGVYITASPAWSISVKLPTTGRPRNRCYARLRVSRPFRWSRPTGFYLRNARRRARVCQRAGPRALLQDVIHLRANARVRNTRSRSCCRNGFTVKVSIPTRSPAPSVELQRKHGPLRWRSTLLRNFRIA